MKPTKKAPRPRHAWAVSSREHGVIAATMPLRDVRAVMADEPQLTGPERVVIVPLSTYRKMKGTK